jgi:CRISPR/Cas system CMR subunit Cmr4 (Cas7 group RAMP superfamily)
MVGVMRFTIEFHSPFRVGTGESSRGSDDAIDVNDPLPASGIKGAMRASATGIGIDPALVDEVFGTAANASSWSWDGGSDWKWSGEDTQPQPRQQFRIRIDELSGTTEEGGLFNVEALWPTVCAFDIDRTGHVTDDRKSLHEAVLRTAARAIHSLGADRTRGFGWVTVTTTQPNEPAVIDDMRLLGLN